MKTIKGPALFLAQFAGDEAPFNSWESITKWAADCGYKGVQVPSWDGRLIDLEKAASSKDYCDEFTGVARDNGVEVTELSTHLQGQLVAVHPAYDEAFDGFAAPEVRGNPKARQQWAVEQVKMALKASQHMGINAMASFSGALAWPYVYPWPQRPAGLVETAFDELARRWRPILDHAEDCGVDICYEIHPGEDLHDGVTFEMFLERVGNHARCNMLYDPSHYLLQCLDYLDNIDIYKRPDPDVPRQGRGIQSDRTPGRLFRLPELGGPGRAVPLARRRPGRFRRDLLEDGGQRFRRLGRGRMGMLPQASRGRGARGRAVRLRPHHPRHRARLRRFRRWRHRRRRQPPHARHFLNGRSRHDHPRFQHTAARRIRLGMVGGGRDAFIGGVHRIASRIDDRYELVAGAFSSTPENRRRRAPISASRPTAPMATSSRWRSARRG
jgi:sugar phosphate isomerase/epimerase